MERGDKRQKTLIPINCGLEFLCSFLTVVMEAVRSFIPVLHCVCEVQARAAVLCEGQAGKFRPLNNLPSVIG